MSYKMPWITLLNYIPRYWIITRTLQVDIIDLVDKIDT